jgi:hypothetical protein
VDGKCPLSQRVVPTLFNTSEYENFNQKRPKTSSGFTVPGDPTAVAYQADLYDRFTPQECIYRAPSTLSLARPQTSYHPATSMRSLDSASYALDGTSYASAVSASVVQDAPVKGLALPPSLGSIRTRPLGKFVDVVDRSQACREMIAMVDMHPETREIKLEGWQPPKPVIEPPRPSTAPAPRSHVTTQMQTRLCNLRGNVIQRPGIWQQPLDITQKYDGLVEGAITVTVEWYCLTHGYLRRSTVQTLPLSRWEMETEAALFGRIWDAVCSKEPTVLRYRRGLGTLYLCGYEARNRADGRALRLSSDRLVTVGSHYTALLAYGDCVRAQTAVREHAAELRGLEVEALAELEQLKGAAEQLGGTFAERKARLAEVADLLQVGERLETGRLRHAVAWAAVGWPACCR